MSTWLIATALIACAIALPRDPEHSQPIQLNLSTYFIPEKIFNGPPINATLTSNSEPSLLGDGWQIRYEINNDSPVNLSAVHVDETVRSAFVDARGWPPFQYMQPDPQRYNFHSWPEYIFITGYIENEERLEWGWLAVMLTWIYLFIGRNQYSNVTWKPEQVFITRYIPGKYETNGKLLGWLTTTTDPDLNVTNGYSLGYGSSAANGSVSLPTLAMSTS